MSRNIAAGTAAMANRDGAQLQGPEADSPARMAGNAEAQATMVTTTAVAVAVSKGGSRWPDDGGHDNLRGMSAEGRAWRELIDKRPIRV